MRNGRGGEDAVIKVPVGTQVLDEDRETVLADLTRPGERVTLAKGGAGGFGNTHFKSSTNQAPRQAGDGEPGEEHWVWLRLKLIADIGLVGLPNAGKSTLLAAATRARPKIADYPFTTLHPGLGVAYVGQDEMVLADIPGLIAGAHEGAGLGDRFLGHIERCAVLVHLVDGTEDNPAENYRTVRDELAAYGAGLDGKPELVALNKCDALTDEDAAAKAKALKKAAGGKVYLLSGVSGRGLDEILDAAHKLVQRARERAHAAEAETVAS